MKKQPKWELVKRADGWYLLSSGNLTVGAGNLVTLLCRYYQPKNKQFRKATRG